MKALGGLGHLTRRFFEVLRARPLTADERAEVRMLLSGQAEERLFFSQPASDQQHALAAARLAPASLRRAALFHDVGKHVSGLGVIRRVMASIAAILHIPVSGRFAAYLDHGPLGAKLLEEAGVEEMAVTYARFHHDARPPGFPEHEWSQLIEVDRKARPGTGSPIR
jgi:hypothetical protein